MFYISDFKMINAGMEIELQSPDQAVSNVLSMELLASTPESMKTTVTISIPISTSHSTLMQIEPQSVYDKAFENHLVKF